MSKSDLTDPVFVLVHLRAEMERLACEIDEMAATFNILSTRRQAQGFAHRLRDLAMCAEAVAASRPQMITEEQMALAQAIENLCSVVMSLGQVVEPIGFSTSPAAELVRDAHKLVIDLISEALA